MTQQPIPLTPEDIGVLIRCSLHYHFQQQKSALPAKSTVEPNNDKLVKDAIQQLHAAGGPTRLSLRKCLAQAQGNRQAQRMIEHYYQRLRTDWANMIAGNETMSLKISIAGVSLQLHGTLDRLDKTSDGGVLAILFRSDNAPLPTADHLRRDPALTIYHALVAATYPLKRPVRLQELWLRHNRDITVELDEDEYRANLGLLREPVRTLARGEVRARPGHHCDTCPFKYCGCPVYAHETRAETDRNDFAPPNSDGKIPPRQWTFKI